MGKDTRNKKQRNNKKESANKTEYHHGGNNYRAPYVNNQSSVLFCDGNPMSFALARRKIEDRFFQHECLDYIAYDPATIEDPPVESNFDIAEPTEQDMVDNQITNNRASTVTHFANINAMVTANAAGITGAEIAKVNMSNAQKEIEALRAVDMTRTSLLSLFHTAHSN